jgi:hypothetical protein
MWFTLDGGMQIVQQVDRLAEASANELSYTFSKQATQRLYKILHTAGIGAATAYCIYEAPLELKPFCSITVTLILAAFAGEPDKDQCYQVYATAGWRPIGARIVNC